MWNTKIIIIIIIIIIINDKFYSALSKSSKALYNQGEKLKIKSSGWQKMETNIRLRH